MVTVAWTTLSSLPSAEPNRDMLTRSGFFDRFGKEWLFPSLQDAVNHAEMGVRLVSGRGQVECFNSPIVYVL